MIQTILTFYLMLMYILTLYLTFYLAFFLAFLWHFTWNIFWRSIWQLNWHGPWGPESWRASHSFQVRLWGDWRRWNLETTWVTKNSTHQEIVWSPDSVRGGFQKDSLVHRAESDMNAPGHHWVTRFYAWCLYNPRGPPWEKHPQIKHPLS